MTPPRCGLKNTAVLAGARPTGTQSSVTNRMLICAVPAGYLLVERQRHPAGLVSRVAQGLAAGIRPHRPRPPVANKRQRLAGGIEYNSLLRCLHSHENPRILPRWNPSEPLSAKSGFTQSVSFARSSSGWVCIAGSGLPAIRDRHAPVGDHRSIGLQQLDPRPHRILHDDGVLSPRLPRPIRTPRKSSTVFDLSFDDGSRRPPWNSWRLRPDSIPGTGASSRTRCVDGPFRTGKSACPQPGVRSSAMLA